MNLFCEIKRPVTQTGRADNPLVEPHRFARETPKAYGFAKPVPGREREIIYLNFVSTTTQRCEASRILSELRLNVLFPGPEK